MLFRPTFLAAGKRFAEKQVALEINKLRCYFIELNKTL